MPAATVGDAASFKVENGIVKFYFATDKADLATGSEAALAEVAKGVAAGKRAVVSGFTDATGDPARNEELAKAREAAVSAALATAGVAADKIEVKKPESITGSGSNAEARRVEVALN
jgi:K(+)-stimulated pyrophosphate-energized sodium pump